MRLSEEQLTGLEGDCRDMEPTAHVDPDTTWCGVAYGELIALVAGYRRSEAYEALLEEWVRLNRYERWNNPDLHDEPCTQCGRTDDHDPDCLVARTDALLAREDA